MITKKVRRRFSLLMLGEGEYYFQDYGGHIYLNPMNKTRVATTDAGRGREGATEAESEDPNYTMLCDRKQIKGRFHVASGSIVFEPDDMRYPVSRIPYDQVTSMRKIVGKARGRGARARKREYLLVDSKLVVEMKENNEDRPYSFRQLDNESGEGEFAFSLSYVKIDDVITELQRLFGLSKRARNERESSLETIIAKREASTKFEISWLVDYSERPQHPNGQAILAHQITPLMDNPGRMMLTDRRLYVSHFNNVSSEPLDKYELSAIKSIHRRRYIMRDVGIEILFRDSRRYGGGGGGDSASFLQSNALYLAFENRATRDQVFDLMLKQPPVRCDSPGTAKSIAHFQRLWQRREISNYQYLLHVNHAAGRSFNDITQYPVFPWVVADYTSSSLDLSDPKTFRDLTKPVGALNPKRLQTFRRRMRDMGTDVAGKPFLYGTHYSTPGYVLYFLVRKFPEYMLRLQSGHFDHADRLFHSMSSAFHSCLESNTDVKELIPEFYNVETRGDFLLNTKNLDLGVRQDGAEVDDLVLPPWADSPRDFVQKMRNALESKYVSDNLHHWVDLIFGFKQTGEEAVKADNLFYPLTYEGAVDIEKVKDATERASIRAQIREFGQTPRKIFDTPHPARDDPVPDDEEGDAKTPAASAARSAESLVGSILEGKRASGGERDGSAGARAAAGGSAGAVERAAGGAAGSSISSTTKVRPSPRKRGRGDKRNSSGRVPSSPSSEPLRQSMLHSDQTRNPYAWQWGEFKGLFPQRSIRAHRKTLMDLCVDNAGTTVCSVGRDATLTVHTLGDGKRRRNFKVGTLALSSCALTPDASKVILGSWDNTVYLYSIKYGRVLDSGVGHDDAVAAVATAEDKIFSASWDGTVKMWQMRESRVHPIPILDYNEHDDQANCICTDPTARVACSAAQDGEIIVWDTRKGKAVRRIDAHDREITGLALSNTGYDVTSTCGGGRMRTFDLTTGEGFVDVKAGETLACCVTDGDAIFTGGSAGIVKLWGMNDSETRERIKSDKLGAPITAVSLSRDGTWLAAGVDVPGDGNAPDVRLFRTDAAKATAKPN